MNNRNLLYVIPDLKKVSGGPRTRISMFKKVFLDNGNIIVELKGKFKKSIRVGKVNVTYVESATNRISIEDFFSLIIVRLYSKNVTVFIRDVYVELFPHEFNSLRKKVTMIANRISYFFLTLIANTLVFPTKEMGSVFFKKNTFFPKRNYFALPPGTLESVGEKRNPDFKKKIGILYLGGISYSQSGFEYFINFSDKYNDKYNFYVLSGDLLVKTAVSGRHHIVLDSIEHSQINSFITNNNIGFAYHTRPRNDYDDITFPIKVLDFLTFRLPFITADHKPLVELLGKDYPFFIDVNDELGINKRINDFCNELKYNSLVNNIDCIALKNTYENRYDELMSNIIRK